ELGRRDTPLPVAALFMCVRGAKLHRPQRPGSRVRSLRRRLGEQFELMYSRTALPVRGPQTVGSGIAAADDDDTLPLSRDRLVQDGIPGVSLVLLGEVIQRQMDALQLSPGNRQLPGLLGA